MATDDLRRHVERTTQDLLRFSTLEGHCKPEVGQFDVLLVFHQNVLRL